MIPRKVCSKASQSEPTDMPPFTINFVSVFPEYFDSPLRCSLVGKAVEQGLVRVRAIDPRLFMEDGERIDDYPYGGGPGMVMRAEPIIAAVESIPAGERGRVLLMSAAGIPFTQEMAEELASCDGLTLVCGRYEGIDQRAVDVLEAVEVAVSDAVLAGGEAAALVIAEATLRLVEGVVGNTESLRDESFVSGLLEYPHYTRPRVVRGLKVPEVLLSGDHGAIARWRRDQAILRTASRRPDLLERAIEAGNVGRDEVARLLSDDPPSA